ncbi:MAG: mRNA-decapping enzyme subunit 2 [Caeruleum heppii]|nr:MAG: mRNA-decapping enzyme subunit 2 [Caeruleum heppii]
MAETKMQLEDWFDDLCVRFIINLPQEELESVERICFQVEEAQWFYEDFIRPLDPTLPSLSLRSFCLRIFQHCPLLSEFSQYHHSTAFSEFLAYKTRVPVRGAILLNDAMDHVLLVKGWKKGAHWSFPRGKINKDERDLDCAIREVYEETGYDITEAGLVKEEAEMKYIEVTMKEQNMQLYVFRGVAMDTHFEPRTRKEISKIAWHKLSELPTFKKKAQHQDQDENELAINANKFYMVAPFLVPLKKWIAQQKKRDAHAVTHNTVPYQRHDFITEEEPTTENEGVATIHHLPSMPSGQSEYQTIPTPLLDDSTSDPSAQLKQLLNIQPMGPASEQTTSKGTPQMVSNEQRSNALLALLQRGHPKATVSEGQGQGQLPQTPLEAITRTPPPPRSPQHHHQQHPSSKAPSSNPPPFSLAPAQGRTLTPNPPPSQPSPQRSPRPQGNYVHYQTSNLPQPPAPFPQPFTGPTPHGPIIPTKLQPTQVTPQLPATSVPATGFPHFGDTHAPIAPPASTLPLPKLTSHSLKLLNVLKDPSARRPDATLQRSEHQAAHNPVPADPKTESIHSGLIPTAPSSVVPPSLQAARSSISGQANQDGAGQPRLRRSDVTAQAEQHVSPVQDFPPRGRLRDTAPIELSAQRSPGRASARPVDLTQRAQARRNKAVDVAANSARRDGYAPTAKSNGVVAKPSKHPTQPNPPISILQRPRPATPEVSHGTQTTTKTKKERTRLPSPGSAAPKSFQPQILRRPAPTTQPPPNGQPAPDPSALPHHLSFDRRGKQSADHKATLLSLFNGPSAVAAPNGKHPAVAPVLASEAKRDGAAEVKENAQPVLSRVGSMASQAGEGRDERRPGSGTQTPITPVDKEFLLGFLEGVARGQKR